MALPDLRRLAIGPLARTEGGPVPHLPEELWRIIGAFVYAHKVDEWAEQRAREHPPLDTLTQYYELCKIAADGNSVENGNSVGWRWNAVRCDPVELRTRCRDVLMAIFRAYGWKEWLKMSELTPPHSCYLTIDRRKSPLQNYTTLAELRNIATLHALCYVTDDDADDRGVVIATSLVTYAFGCGLRIHLRWLSFEYVATSTLNLMPSSSLADGGRPDFNGLVSRWNPRSLRNGSELFKGCITFQGRGVDMWTMPALQNADRMFDGCHKFEANVSHLNPISLRSASNMFDTCLLFTGNGLERWAGDNCATNLPNLSNAIGMFNGCGKMDILKVKNWRLPNVQLKATGMFNGVPINEFQAEELAKSMRLNPKGTQDQMTNFNPAEIMYIIMDKDTVVSDLGLHSFGELRSENPLHVAYFVFGRNEKLKYRGPDVMPHLAEVITTSWAAFAADTPTSP